MESLEWKVFDHAKGLGDFHDVSEELVLIVDFLNQPHLVVRVEVNNNSYDVERSKEGIGALVGIRVLLDEQRVVSQLERLCKSIEQERRVHVEEV